MKSVYCAVRTGSLNKAVCCIYLRTNSDLCHLQQKLIGKADNLPPYRAVVMKAGSLNFLKPSGPAQACYGRTLSPKG